MGGVNVDTTTKVAIIQFWGGPADGKVIEMDYPMPAYIHYLDSSYRLYCSWPFFDTRLARYKIVRTT